MRLGHRLAAMGAVAVFATSVALGLASVPALADTPPASVSVTPSSPVASTKTPTIAGHFGPALGPINSFSVVLTRTGGQSITAGCDNVSFASADKSCTHNEVDFTWKPSLAYNGRYHLQGSATATYTDLGNAGCALTPCTWPNPPASADFAMAFPPAAPKGLITEVSNASRTVNVSWARNTEPDMIGYVVERADSGGAFAPVASVPQGDGTRISIADQVPDAGKIYSYRVTAVRQGADACDPKKPGDCDAKAVKSTPSPALLADVPAGAPAGAGARVPGGLNLTGVGAPKGRASSSSGYIGPPDTGYKTNLPYDNALPAADLPAEPPSTEAPHEAALPVTPKRTVTHTLNVRALAIPLAGGAILFVLALQLRWLTSRMTRVHDLA